MANIREFPEKKLRIKVNEKKSGADRSGRREFLNFTLMSRAGKVYITP